MKLIKYEAACRALAECKSVDEAVGLREQAAEVVIRAERRIGELLNVGVA